MTTEDDLTLEQRATNHETWKHINTVMRLLERMKALLTERMFSHDRSKLDHPEVEIFTEFTPKLADTTYGSDEYKGYLKAMKPALDHHYANHRHHPEFWEVDEEWRPVPGYEGHYEVSSHGGVRSVDRVVDRPGRGDKVTKRGQPRKGHVTAKGYVRMQFRKNGKIKNFMVHCLVAQAFLPNPEGKPEVNHVDGDKQNNSVVNLEWATPGENLEHAYETGLRQGAVKHVYHCPDLDLTTFGAAKMAAALRKRGYERASASGIWGAADRDGKHLGLRFESAKLVEWQQNRLSGMTLIDLTEMFADWAAACKRHKDGDLVTSIRINAERFGLDPQLAKILYNSVSLVED